MKQDKINLPITLKRWQDKDLSADIPTKPITTEPPKTYGDKYKSLFDRGREIITPSPKFSTEAKQV